MKIISNYNDYYDKTAHLYGGGDPKIVYVRPFKMKNTIDLKESMFADLKDKRFKWDTICTSTLLDNVRSLQYRSYDKRNPLAALPTVRIIVVWDTVFTQIQDGEKYRMLRETDLQYKVKNTKDNRGMYYFKKEREMVFDDFINHKYPILIDICKKLGEPAFSFTVSSTDGDWYRNRIDMDNVMPNLGKIGIGNFIDSNTMYQNLSYIVGNLINESPDMMAPNVVPNDIKILSGGFDLKTSFRGKK